MKTTVYNPVSLGSFFNGGCVFKNYWIGTGSQSIVNEVVKNNPKLFSSDNKIEIGKSSLSSFEVKNLLGKNASPNAIYSYLVQAGYMTIKGVDGGRYVLSYPNLEVKDAMETSILENSYGLDIYSEDFSELRKLFASGDTASIINIFQKFFISFPYDMSLKKERGYQIAFSAVLKAIGFKYIEMEEKTNIGRIDISLEVNEKLYYIIELKLDGSAEEALKQIKEKKYHEKYSRKGNVIHLLGINFSSKERNLADWKEEIVVC